MANFASVLKKLRTTQHNMTQAELAAELNKIGVDVSASAIGMWEQGRREPDFETLEAISDYFNVDIDYLLGKSDYITRIIKGDDLVANDPNEKELLVLFREAGQNQAEKERLVKLFESTVDVFMEAKGIDPNKPDED